jgi:flagellar motor switch protein FliG
MPIVADSIRNKKTKSYHQSLLPSSNATIEKNNNAYGSQDNKKTSGLSELAIEILKHLYPSEVSDVKTMAYVLKTSNSKIIDTIYYELSDYCAQDKNKNWKISTAGFIKINKEWTLHDN